MKCPNCNTELRIADRQGIEIDYCPECRGVWLDRGELDKLIERSTAYELGATRPMQQQQWPESAPPTPPQYQPVPPYQQNPPYPQVPPQQYPPQYNPGYNRDYDDDDEYRSYDKRRKRGGFLTDLFDFD